jgi:hypothetical protein
VILLGYYISNAPNKKSIIEECRSSFVAYLTSNQKMIPLFFQQLMKVTELEDTLSKVVLDIVQSRISIEEEFE